MRREWKTLSLWNDGVSKSAIVDFVENAASAVPPEERVAVFDNDGTLWCEKPMPIQLDFILRRLSAMAEADPELRERQPWKAAHERDYGWLSTVMTEHYAGDDTNVRILGAGILSAFDGMSVEEFEAQSDGFLRVHSIRRSAEAISTARTRRWSSCSLTWGGTGSRTTSLPAAVATSCGRSARSSMGSRARGHRQHGGLAYANDGRGGTITHRAEPDYLDDGPVKPVRIWSRVGRRPLLAARQLERRHPDARLHATPRQAIDATPHPSR